MIPPPMKTSPLLRPLIVFNLLACLACAQTATWLGQSPSDPNRLSSWTDSTNWSTGSVPNGATAVAQVDQAVFTPGGLLQRDNLQILNSTVTLDGLQYGLYVPYSYYYPYLNTPSLTVGGTGVGDYGILDFVGAGITGTNSNTYYYPNPVINLQNGRLTFSNNAKAAVSVAVNASTGTNSIWFRDNSTASNIAVTLNASSRLDFTGHASLLNSSVIFQGGHISFNEQTYLLNSSISIYGPGFISFSGQATLLYPYFSFGRPAPANDSIVRFSGNVQVQGGTAYSYGNSGVLEFTDQANTSGMTVNYLRTLDLTGASTGAGTTGRQRAVVSTPAATSVVADDARTVSLGYVAVEDLLLGSNSVSLSGGNLRYISDAGGAYLSANGDNLTGGGIIQNSYNYLYLNSTNAVSPYAVPLTINGGSVYTYREKLGPVTVNPGASIALYAGSAASILNNGTVHVPNQPNKTYQVTGTFTQSAGGNIVWGIIPHTGITGPPLQVVGQATLDGTLTVYDSGYFVGSRRFPLLRAGSITGRFTTAPDRKLSPMLSVGVEYTGNEVAFTYIQRPFVNAGATPSQQALGAHLDATLANATGAYYNLIYHLNTLQDPAAIAAGLGELAPDRYGVLNEHGFALAASRQAALDRRLAGLRSAQAKGFTLFVESGQVQNKFAALEGLPEVALRTSGGLAGSAWREGRWTVGATIARDRTRADLDAFGGHATIKATTPGLFAQYDTGRFFIQGAASQSNDKYTLLRGSGLYARTSLLSAAVSGTRTDLSLTAGSTFTGKAKDWSVTPYVGLLSSQVRIDDFAETRAAGGTGTELAFKHWSLGSLRTRAGLDLTSLAAHGRVTPRLSVVWLHELKRERGISTGLVGTNGAFYRAPGRPAETDIVQASFGLDWRISRQLTFSVNAGLARGRNSDTTSDLSAGFRWEF